MATVWQKIEKAIRNLMPKGKETSLVTLPKTQTSKTMQTQEISNRQSGIRASRKMFTTDGRIAEPIQMHASNLIGSGITVTVTETVISGDVEKCQEIIDDLINRLNLNSEMVTAFIDVMINGDGFFELIFDSDSKIINISSKPQIYMYRHTDDSDIPIDVTRMYYYSENQQNEAPKYNDETVVWFSDWQMIHVRNNYIKKGRYGTPTFLPSIGAWEKLTRGEQNASINRMFYSQKTLVHYLKGYNKEEIEEYERVNLFNPNNPYDAIAQYFVSGEGEIKSLNSSGGIGDITDIEHFVRATQSASPIPTVLLDYLSGGGSLSDSGLKYKLSQYYSRVRAQRTWVIDSFIKPLINTQLLALGKYNNHVKYNIKFIDSELVDAIILQGLVGLNTSAENGNNVTN